MKAKMPWILLVVSLLGSGYLFLLLLNAGAELDDARSQSSRYQERSGMALEILKKDWLGRRGGQVDALSRDLEKRGAVVGSEEGAVLVGDFRFSIRDGKVEDLGYIDP